MVAEWAEQAALTNCRSNGVRGSRSSGNNGISSTARRSSTGSSNIVDLGAAVVAAAQRAIATTWPTSTLHCKHTYPALSVAFSWLACCLLVAPCCLCPCTCLLVAVCLLPPAMALLSLFVAAAAVAPGAATIIIAIAAVVVGTASATGHKPPRRRHRAASTPRRQGGLSCATVRGSFQCA